MFFFKLYQELYELDSLKNNEGALDLSLINLSHHDLTALNHTNSYFSADQSSLPRPELTFTEELVCVGMAFGLTAKEIAKARGSSYRTIERHIANIKSKVGCKRLPPIMLMRLVEKHIPKALL
jgi:DNA-binding NarL/FixJ family response regulator